MITAATEKLQSAGLAVSTNTPEGDPREVLVEAASSWKAGSRVLNDSELAEWINVLLGSVSASVAAMAGCSVEKISSVPDH